jgi:hypothetical protein
MIAPLAPTTLTHKILRSWKAALDRELEKPWTTSDLRNGRNFSPRFPEGFGRSEVTPKDAEALASKLRKEGWVVRVAEDWYSGDCGPVPNGHWFVVVYHPSAPPPDVSDPGGTLWRFFLGALAITVGVFLWI